ncbi:MAG: DUF1501 domain-containing protein, partial [Planctomycetaceae bacterium]
MNLFDSDTDSTPPAPFDFCDPILDPQNQRSTVYSLRQIHSSISPALVYSLRSRTRFPQTRLAQMTLQPTSALSAHSGCRPGDHPALGRRSLLQIGGLGLIGAGCSDLLRLQAHAKTRSAGRAKSVVFIFQSGGPSQHETFDPKPGAPETIRGAY